MNDVYGSTTAGFVPGTTGSASQQLLQPGQAFRGDQGASRLLGSLNRAQWADWKARFAPYIEQLGNYAADDAVPEQAANQAGASMGMAFDNAGMAQDMARQGFGVNQTEAQRQAADRREAVQRTGAIASASNQARIAGQDRQMQILGGGMGLSNIPDKVLQS